MGALDLALPLKSKGRTLNIWRTARTAVSPRCEFDKLFRNLVYFSRDFPVLWAFSLSGKKDSKALAGPT